MSEGKGGEHESAPIPDIPMTVEICFDCFCHTLLSVLS
jgi:hypothetical protein